MPIDPSMPSLGPARGNVPLERATQAAIAELEPILLEACDRHGGSAVMNALMSFWLSSAVQNWGVAQAREALNVLWLAAPDMVRGPSQEDDDAA